MKNATAPHITPATFPAIATIDTRHVEDHGFRVYHPSYAMVSIQSPEWGWDEEDDDRRVVTGYTINGPFAVKVSRGASLVATLRTYHDYNPICGDSIHTAIAMSQEDYDAYVAAVNEQDTLVCAEF